jgi:hypothetical protein
MHFNMMQLLAELSSIPACEAKIAQQNHESDPANGYWQSSVACAGG